MRLLLFSDLHCDAHLARKLVDRAKNVDVLVGAGDFGSLRRRTEVCIEVLKTIEKPAVLVAGNNESTDELIEVCKAWRSATVLHGSGIEIQGVRFFGLGGGVPITPFGAWSYDFSEEQAANLLKDCPKGSVLVSHSPPKGVCDVASGGASLGSTAVRAAIVRCEPKLVVCGHIHSSAGKQGKIGATTVINAGPLGVEFVYCE